MWRCAAAAGAGVWHFLCKTKATSASSWAAHPHDFTKCRVLHRLNVEGRRLGGQTHDGDGTETRERKSTMWNLLWKKSLFSFFQTGKSSLFILWKFLFRLLLCFLIFWKIWKKFDKYSRKGNGTKPFLMMESRVDFFYPNRLQYTYIT